jgi:plastocyanin
MLSANELPNLRRIAFGLLSAIAFMGGAAQASTVRVSVTDAEGKPLPQAVVMLYPKSGKVQVQPMAPVEVSQKDRRFRPQVTLITVGTSVVFSNFDTVKHHVYSFSKAKTFELKLYSGVPDKGVEFDKPGVAIVGCNIHDAMASWIVVADTPLHAQADAAGVARVDDVEPGDYRMWVWHPGLPALTDGVSSLISVGPSDLAQSVQLTL